MGKKLSGKTPHARPGEGCMRYDPKRRRYVFVISYRNTANELKRKTFYGATEEECRAKAQDFKDTNVFSLPEELQTVTIPQLLKNHYAYQHDMNLIQDATFTRKLFTVSIIEDRPIGKVPIIKVTEDMLKGFLLSIKSYSNSVIRKVYSAVFEAYELAQDNYIFTKIPFSKRKIPKPISDKPDKKVMAFTVEQERLFIKGVKEYKWQKGNTCYGNQFLISLFTGLRMGEVNALREQDIDFNKNVIHVCRSITVDSNYRPIVGQGTKTKAGDRYVPIPKVAVDVLKNAIESAEPNEFGLIFCNCKTKGPISTSAANDSFRRICEKNNIPNYGQHSLRHTFATRSIEAGVNADVLAKWLGHTDICITLNTYHDVFDERSNKTVSIYDSYMSSLYD